jgi:hypothetical protein
VIHWAISAAAGSVVVTLLFIGFPFLWMRAFLIVRGIVLAESFEMA